jgi:hypothetical protein
VSFDNPLDTNKPYYAPPDDLRLMLDEHVGQETFHLLASNERLTVLETLINDHASAGAEAKIDLSGKIVAEIGKLRRSALKAIAEKPTDMGGNVRSARNRELAKAAVELSGERFFAKSFTIDHR